MRIRLWMKLSMLAALAVFTSIVTSSVLARGKPPRAQRSNAARASDTPTQWGFMKSGEQHPVPVDLDTSFASGAMHRIKVEIAANAVHIVGSASIRDTRPGMSYVWAARVLHPTTENVLYEKRYDNQLFQMPAANEMIATFDDTIEIPLAPGSYTVELVALTVHPDEEPAVLNKVTVAKNRRGPVGRAPTVLGE